MYHEGCRSCRTNLLHFLPIWYKRFHFTEYIEAVGLFVSVQVVTSVSVFTIGLVRRVWIATIDLTTALSTIDMFASSLKVNLVTDFCFTRCCDIVYLFVSL